MKSPAVRAGLSASGLVALLWGYTFCLGPADLFNPKLKILVLFSLGVLCALLILFLISASYSSWVLTLIAMVPLEISTPLPPLPSFSSIDYFCACALIAFLMREQKNALHKLWKAFSSRLVVAGFLMFLVWGCVDALAKTGSVRPVLRWGEFLFVYVIAALAASEESNHLSESLCTLCSIAGVLMATLGIAQCISSLGNFEAMQGTFHQHNAMAAYLSLMFWPALGRMWFSPGRKTAQITSILIAASLVFTFSRGAWFGLGVAGAACLWRYAGMSFVASQIRRRNLILLGSLSVVCAGILIFLNLNRFLSISARDMYWKAGSAVLQKHPLAGLGPGNYPVQIRDYLEGKAKDLYDYEFNQKKNRIDFWQYIHNLYLQIMVDYGLIGFLFWLVGFGGLIYRALSSVYARRPSLFDFYVFAIAAFLAHNFFDVTTINSFDLVIASFIGLCCMSKAGFKEVQA